MNIHNKRSGRAQLGLYGGVQLPLDISKAFDCLPREDLWQAMIEAQVGSDMIGATASCYTLTSKTSNFSLRT